jgi:hypothetical protein
MNVSSAASDGLGTLSVDDLDTASDLEALFDGGNEV